MVGQRKLKRMTVVFAIISVLLWLVEYLVHSNKACAVPQEGMRRKLGALYSDLGVEQDINSKNRLCVCLHDMCI